MQVTNHLTITPTWKYERDTAPWRQEFFSMQKNSSILSFFSLQKINTFFIFLACTKKSYFLAF
eukprot:UN24105